MVKAAIQPEVHQSTLYAIKLMIGEAISIAAIPSGLSIAWISPLTIVINFPELVCVRDFMLSLEILVYIEAISVFLILTAINDPAKM